MTISTLLSIFILLVRKSFFKVTARCLVKGHNIMSAARARTLTVPSELKHTLIRRLSRLPLAILETDGETLFSARDERVSQLCHNATLPVSKAFFRGNSAKLIVCFIGLQR